MRLGRLEIGYGFLLAVAALTLFGGLDALACLLVASAAHEAGHLLVLRACKIPVKRVRLTAIGAVIVADTSSLGFGTEALLAAAGPVAGLVLAAVASRIEPLTKLAGLSAALSILNLLPCAGLDGGRILRSALSLFTAPDAADRAMTAVTCATALTLAVLAVLAKTPAASLTLLMAAMWSAAGLTSGV